MRDSSRTKTAGYLLIVVFLILNTIIQVLFKCVAMGPGGRSYWALAFEPMFYFCCVLFVAQAVTWLAVLRRMPLSKVYPFTSLTVITLLASGAIFFEERISLGNLLGGMVIMAGVVVIAKKKDSKHH